MKRLLQDLAQRADPATRRRETDRWEAPPPAWMTPGDKLRTLYRQLPQLLDHGELTWGVVFMANTDLWEPGDADHPMGVVYSFDPWYQRRPERLHLIGRRLFDFHGSEEPPPMRPWERSVRDTLHTGYERVWHQELPPSISGGRVVYHAGTVCHRAHLPGGHLSDNVLPLLVQRHGDPRICMPVPSHYWPQELLSRWGS